MDINVTFDSSAITAPAGFETDVEAVAKFYDSQFSNPITINIDVGWGEIDGQALSADDLGESESNYTTTPYSYAQIKDALDNSALTSQAQAAVATLPGPDPTGGGAFGMTTAEAKALGLMGASSAIDGYAGFTSEAGTFDFAIDSNTSTAVVPASEYDFFAVAAHEFSEIMGRQMNFGINYGEGPGDGSGYYPLDLFDYSAPGVRSFNQSASDRYFSVDGGNTNLDNFNTQSSGDLFDWANSAGNDAYDAFANPGVVNQVTATDFELMNIIGYQPTPDFQAVAFSMSGATLNYGIYDLSEGAAPASQTAIYLGASPNVTTADTLLATVATPMIAGNQVSKGAITLSLPADLAAANYYVGIIPDANGAITESNTTNNITPGLEIEVVDSANVAAISGVQSADAFDLSGADLSGLIAVDGYLTVRAALGGAGTLEVAAGEVLLDPGAQLSVAAVKVTGVSAIVNVNTDIAYSDSWTEISTGAQVSVGAGDTLTLTGSADSFAGILTGAGAVAIKGGETDFDTSQYGGAPRLAVAEVAVSGAATKIGVNINLIYARDWDQTSGTLSVASGHAFKLSGAGDVLMGTLSGVGTVDLTGAGDTLKDVTLSAARVKIDAASVNLAGAIDLTGLLSLTSPDVVIETGAIARLTGGGAMALSAVSTNAIIGASAGAILENSDRIEGAGNLGGGQLNLTNEAEGIIEGDATEALVIDTGADAFTNAGLILAAGAGGLAIDDAVRNTGVLEAARGTLTVAGAVTGAGSVRVSSGAAEFAAAFAENVAFTSAGGTLALADAAAYSGEISGFSRTGASALDLEDISFATATESYSGTAQSGVLTVTDGTHTARIGFAGNYKASEWTLAKDASGGTIVTDPTAAAPSARVMASAMAGLAPAAAAASAPVGGHGAAPAAMLARPGGVTA
jgi:hypothetical protein